MPGIVGQHPLPLPVRGASGTHLAQEPKDFVAPKPVMTTERGKIRKPAFTRPARDCVRTDIEEIRYFAARQNTIRRVCLFCPFHLLIVCEADGAHN